MKLKEIAENAKETINLLDQGAFLTTKFEDKMNTMIISWGYIGQFWGKPSFMVMVRKSRYSHDLMERSGEFTLTMPKEAMKEAASVCGSKSGRDMDKFASLGLKTRTARAMNTPVIDCKAKQFECKILFRTDMNKSGMSIENYKEFYSDDDVHTLYFAEIIEEYETEKESK